MSKKISELTANPIPLDADVIPWANAQGQAFKMTFAQLKAKLDAIGGGDVTAPTVVTAIVTNANPNQVVITFSEPVTVTTAGWSFRRNTSNWPISSVAGSGTTWTFTMATSAAAGETIDRSYNSTTGNTLDAASNELATFTNSSVTNNVGGGSYEAETLTFEAGLGAVGSGWSLTEKDATNALVVAGKSIGWSKFQAIHIYVGSNLPGAYLNLVNPNNSNAAFRLTASGAAPTLSNGLQMGATSVLDTNFNYATNFASLNSIHFVHCYSGASGEATAGVKDGTFGDAGIIIGGNYGGNNVLASQGGKQYFSTGIGLAAGRLSLSRTAAGDANARLLYNGTVLNAFSSAGGFTANGTITYGSVRNLLTSAQDNAGAHKLTFCSLGTGLTPSEQDTWDTAVQTFLTALGR